MAQLAWQGPVTCRFWCYGVVFFLPLPLHVADGPLVIDVCKVTYCWDWKLMLIPCWCPRTCHHSADTSRGLPGPCWVAYQCICLEWWGHHAINSKSGCSCRAVIKKAHLLCCIFTNLACSQHLTHVYYILVHISLLVVTVSATSCKS